MNVGLHNKIAIAGSFVAGGIFKPVGAKAIVFKQRRRIRNLHAKSAGGWLPGLPVWGGKLFQFYRTEELLRFIAGDLYNRHCRSF